jgi:hypothetical protein
MFSFKVSEHFGLNMMYHLKHFHVMFCMCDDKNNYRCEHRNAQKLNCNRRSYFYCVKILKPHDQGKSYGLIKGYLMSI